MRCLKFLLLISILVVRIDAQAIKLDFGNGHCGMGACEIKSGCGINGGKCVKVIVNSSVPQSVYYSQTIPEMKQNTLWMYTVHTKCSLVNGAPYFGLTDTTADFAETKSATLPNGWTRHDFLVRISSNSYIEPMMRVGIYQRIGFCYFDALSISPAQVKQFDHPTYGPLGMDESIFENGTYSATFGKNSMMGSYRRFFSYSTSSWGGDTFRLWNGVMTSFNHTLKAPFITSPIVVFTISYWTNNAVLMLESSIDGSNWIFVSNTSGLKTVNYTLPSKSHTNLRFTPYGGCTYLTDYTFRAMVAPAVDKALVYGKDLILTVDSKTTITSNLTVEFGLLTSQEGSFTTLPLILTSDSSSSSSSQMKLQIVPGFSDSEMNFSPETLSITPGNTKSINLVYHLAGGIKQSAMYSMISTSDNSILLGGRVFFWPAHFYLDSSYGNLLQSSTATSSLWWCDGTRQIYQYRSDPTTSSTKISINAARNEKEPFQLVVHAKSSSVTINSISITDLNGPNGNKIKSDSIWIRRVGYIMIGNTKEGNTESILGIEWPDMLYPIDNLPFVCPSYTNCPFWFLVSVGPNMTNGDYSGAINIGTSSGSMSASVTLHVWNFSIPKHSRLPSAFGLWSGNIWPWYNLSTASNAVKESEWNRFLNALELHRLSPYSSMSFHGYWGSLQVENGVEKYVLRSDDFKNNIPKYFDDNRFTCFMSNIIGLPSGNYMGTTEGKIEGKFGTYVWGSANHTKLFTECAQQVQSLLESTKILDKSWLYWMDEPASSQFSWIRQINAFIKSIVPKMKILLTTAPTTTATNELAGYVDNWCIPYFDYDYEKAHVRQLLGDTVWNYKALTLHIDNSIMEARTWPLQIYRDNIEGFLFWSSIYWSGGLKYPNSLQDPYEDALGWSGSTELELHFWGNGEGRLFYPPVNWKQLSKQGPITNYTPIETIRLENLREGLEDWEYLKNLEELLKNRPNLPEGIRLNATSLLVIPNTIIEGLYWKHDSEIIMKRRAEIAKILEQIEITQDESEEATSQVNEAVSQFQIKSFVFVISMLFLLAPFF